MSYDSNLPRSLNVQLTGLFAFAVELARRPQGVTKTEELHEYVSAGCADTNRYVCDLREEPLVLKPGMSEKRIKRLNKRNADLAGGLEPFDGSLAQSNRIRGQTHFARYVIRDSGEQRDGEPVFKLYDLKTKSFVNL